MSTSRSGGTWSSSGGTTREIVEVEARAAPGPAACARRRAPTRRCRSADVLDALQEQAAEVRCGRCGRNRCCGSGRARRDQVLEPRGIGIEARQLQRVHAVDGPQRQGEQVDAARLLEDHHVLRAEAPGQVVHEAHGVAPVAVAREGQRVAQEQAPTDAARTAATTRRRRPRAPERDERQRGQGRAEREHHGHEAPHREVVVVVDADLVEVEERVGRGRAGSGTASAARQSPQQPARTRRRPRTSTERVTNQPRRTSDCASWAARRWKPSARQRSRGCGQRRAASLPSAPAQAESTGRRK